MFQSMCRARVALGMAGAFALGCLVTTAIHEAPPRVVLAKARTLAESEVRLEAAPLTLRLAFATPMPPNNIP